MSKVMGILSSFGSFYNALSPNMIMSLDQDTNFKIFYFVLILHLILGKVTKFLVEKLSTSEAINRKPHGGVENILRPPSAFRVNFVHFF